MKKRREWTNKEIEYLTKNYKQMTYKKIGEVLNRSEDAIYNKVKKMNLEKKHRHFKANEILNFEVKVKLRSK